jgi:general secretion pathway protein D
MQATGAERRAARASRGLRAAARLLPAWLLLATSLAAAQAPPETPAEDMVQLDFQNVELTVVIDTIAKATGRNFIYDDRVRGRVTIVSPSPMPVEQAYAVFESVLQVKGFTTVQTPGGALKVIPLRDAKETSVETLQSDRPPPNRDLFVTRLIPLSYIDAESIVNTLKPLVSKDAAIAAYPPTNTVILTESSSNIRRLIAILESIDIETYKEELAVIRVEFADALTLAEQVSEIFGAEVSAAMATTTRRTRASRRVAQPAAAAPTGGPDALTKVRIITDDRTNSLIVLAARTQLEEVRRLVRKLDVPVSGGGRIHVYYLQHADAEELAQTLSAMLSGASTAPTTPSGAPTGGQAQALRAVVSGLSEGLTVTADPATNSLIIQASQEGFNTLAAVIEQLDVERPQVLVEALIMEVLINDQEELGFAGVVRFLNGDTKYAIAVGTDATAAALLGPAADGDEMAAAGADLIENLSPTLGSLVGGVQQGEGEETTIQGIIRAAARDSGTNVISAPHILTSDNEEAEIRIGDNIPIVTSRVDAPTGGAVGLSTSVNVERQDIGVTLRVTPQITEGNTLRLDIFQEITDVNPTLTVATSAASRDSGVSLSKRQIENTVVVADGETVVIGGLISDDYEDTVVKVPWLGDIPVLGWLFKSTSRQLQKKNLLVFLTPHILRSTQDLEKQTIRKREEFVDKSRGALQLSDREQAWEQERMQEARAAGEPYEPGRGQNPVRQVVLDHESRYPLERMRDIERVQREEAERLAGQAEQVAPAYYLQAGLFTEESRAVEIMTEMVDLGYDGSLLTTQRGGQMLYEVRLGPFESLPDAERATQVLQRGYGLAPSILRDAETPEEP